MGQLSRELLCLTVIFAVTLRSVTAANWYISPNGSDSNSGTSADDAFLDLQTALEHCSGGDSVYAAEGVYRGAANVGTSIVLNSVHLYGQEGKTVIFEITEENGIGLQTNGSSSVVNLDIKTNSVDGNYLNSVGLVINGHCVVESTSFYYLFQAIGFGDNVGNVVIDDCAFSQHTSYALQSSSAWESLQILYSTVLSDTSFVDLYISGNVTAGPILVNGTTVENCSMRIKIETLQSLTVTESMFISISNQQRTTGAISVVSDVLDGVTITESTFLHCYATEEGCVHVVPSSAAFIGKADVIVVACTFEENTVPNGALHVEGYGLILTYSNFYANTGTVGAAVYYDDSGVSAFVEIAQTKVDFNNATQSAAVHIEFSSFTSQIGIIGSSFGNNTAPSGNAALEINGGLSFISESVFVFNGMTGSSNGNYAPVAIVGFADALVEECFFEGNYGHAHGALLLTIGLSANVTNSKFVFNSCDTISDGVGGAIFIDEVKDTSVLDSCTFMYNSAAYGGALAVQFASVDVNNCVFYSNSATDAGGGGYCQNSAEVQITNSSFQLNSAPQGSAYYCGNACQTTGSDNYVSKSNSIEGCSTAFD